MRHKKHPPKDLVAWSQDRPCVFMFEVSIAAPSDLEAIDLMRSLAGTARDLGFALAFESA